MTHRPSASTPTERRRPRLGSVLLVLVPLALMAIGLALVATQLRPRPLAATSGSGGAPATETAVTAAASVAAADLAAVTPRTPWLSIPASTALTRIGVGSCLHQKFPQPIWKSIVAARPELFLMLGDNVYGDVTGPQMRELVEAYATQLAQPEFAEARAKIPMLGIWDDHDYGLNDGGAGYEHRGRAEQIFRAYWQLPDRSGPDTGLAYARTYGPPGRRVQVLMLDTRSFRSGLKVKGQSFPHWGKYEPDPDPAKTMLGEAQWAWLAARLAEPAEVRLIASSIQVLAEGHGFERWGNLPGERERLVKLIETSGAGGVVMLSGDRHMGALYKRAIAGGRVLPEMTASSLNRSFGPSKDARLEGLVGGLYHQENYGLVEIDWPGRRVTLRLAGMEGKDFEAVTFGFDELGVKP